MPGTSNKRLCPTIINASKSKLDSLQSRVSPLEVGKPEQLNWVVLLKHLIEFFAGKQFLVS